MATYKRQGTNKYYGAANAGYVSTGSATDGLAKSLAEAGYKVGRAENLKIDREQEEAIGIIDGLYASGKSESDISREILAGKHPKLTGKYNKATTDWHLGKVKASEVFNTIKENIDQYDMEDPSQSLESFMKQYLPDMSEVDSSYLMGFASNFNGLKKELALEDANLRAKLASANKIKEGRTVLSTASLENYVETWKELDKEVINTDGSSKPNRLYTNQELMQVIKDDVAGLLSTAETLADIERIEAIMALNLGEGRDGNQLGSLNSRKTKDVDKLKEILISKRNAIETDELVNENRRKDKTVKDIYKEAFAPNEDGSKKSITQLNNIKEKLKEFGDPKLIDTFTTFFNGNREVINDAEITDNFLLSVAEGFYETRQDVIEAMNAEGIPPAYLEKAMQRFDDYKNDVEQNLQPIYFTDQTYTSSSKSILTVVESKMALNPQEQPEALIAASNYIKTEILDFEADFKEANNGKKPKPEDRRKFMTELSKWVISNYTTDQSIMPKDLVSMDDKRQNEEDLDNLRTTLDVPTVLANVNEALTNLDTIEGFGQQPEFKDFIPFNQPDRLEFYENTYNPQIDKAISSVFPEGVLTKELIEAFSTDELNSLVLNLANQLNVDTSFIRKSMQRLTGAS